MHDYLIDFQGIDWENPASGVRRKIFSKDGQRIRLVEFSDSFVEANWCTKGHVGYILDGRIFIDFDGKIEIEFSSGDGIFILEGEANKHMGRIANGEKSLIILFEKI